MKRKEPEIPKTTMDTNSESINYLKLVNIPINSIYVRVISPMNNTKVPLNRAYYKSINEYDPEKETPISCLPSVVDMSCRVMGTVTTKMIQEAVNASCPF